MKPIPAPPLNRVLIVEDEAIVARDLELCLRQLDYDVVGVESRGEDAVASAEREQPQLVLMDIRLRGQLDGVEAAGEIWRRFEIPTVLLTAYADSATIDRARQRGAFGYLVKPFEPRELRATLEMALHRGAERRTLASREQRFFEVFARLGDGAAVIDADGRVLRSNAAAQEILGPAAPGDSHRVAPGDTGDPDSDLRIQRASGGVVSVKICRVPLTDVAGGEELIVFRDPRRGLRTEQRLAGGEVRDLLQQLAAGVTDGIGNPLFVISTHLDLMGLDGPRAGPDDDVVALLRRQIDRIRTLLGYLTQFAGGEARFPRFAPLGPIVSEAVEGQRARAAERGITLAVADRVPGAVIELETESLRIAFDHLIANAIDFSPDGGKVHVAVDRGAESRMMVTVDDEGRGLRQEDLPRIFDPFFSRRRNSTGLGLAIVRRVVEEHGGTVHAANRSGGGARFVVELPLRR